MRPNSAIEKGDGYRQNGKELDSRSMIETLEREPAAEDHISSYRTNSTIGGVAGAIGGGLIGWPLGAAAAGDQDPPWILAGVGAGFIALAIPFAIMAGNNLENAVDVHNSGLRVRSASEARAITIDWFVNATPSGGAVVLRGSL